MQHGGRKCEGKIVVRKEDRDVAVMARRSVKAVMKRWDEVNDASTERACNQLVESGVNCTVDEERSDMCSG